MPEPLTFRSTDAKEFPILHFPNAQHGEFELAKDAARFYQSGPPLLQRYLPFWLANLVDRMWVAAGVDRHPDSAVAAGAPVV